MSFASFGSNLLRPTGETRPDRPALVGRFSGGHVLVPLLDPGAVVLDDQVRVAASLARATGASLSLVNPLASSGGRAVRTDAGEADDEALLAWAHERPTGASTDGGLLRDREVVKAILRSVDADGADLLVLPGGDGADSMRRSLAERIGPRADCDVVVVNGRPGYRRPPSILLPVAGGPHSGLATDVAGSIADDADAWVDVLHVVPDDASADRRAAAESLVERVARRLDRPETTSTRVIEAADVVEALVEQSGYYGLTVMGAPTKGRLRRFLAGSTSESIRADARSVVLSARNNREPVASEAR